MEGGKVMGRRRRKVLGSGKAASGVCCQTSYTVGHWSLSLKSNHWYGGVPEPGDPHLSVIAQGLARGVNSLVLPAPSWRQVSGLRNSPLTEMADGSQAAWCPEMVRVSTGTGRPWSHQWVWGRPKCPFCLVLPHRPPASLLPRVPEAPGSG